MPSTPTRIVSLVPGATDALVAMGLAGAVVGRSHECDHPAVAAAPPLTRPLGPAPDAAGDVIDRAVRAAAAAGSAMDLLDARALRACRADLVVVQGLCGVCAVGPEVVREAVGGSDRAPQILELSPLRLADVLDDVVRLARAAGAEPAGHALVGGLRGRLERVRAPRRGAPPRRVVCLEWLDPLFAAGHWIPDVVAAAGGHDPLGRPGGRSVEITDDDLLGADPQTIVLAPCGLDAAGAWREAERIGLAERLERHDPSPSVVAIDAGRLLSRPGPGLAEGAEALAGMLAGPLPSLRGAPAGIAA